MHGRSNKQAEAYTASSLIPYIATAVVVHCHPQQVCVCIARWQSLEGHMTSGPHESHIELRAHGASDAPTSIAMGTVKSTDYFHCRPSHDRKSRDP